MKAAHSRVQCSSSKLPELFLCFSSVRLTRFFVTMCTMYKYDDHNSKCCSPLKLKQGYLYTVYNFAGVTKNKAKGELYIYIRVWNLKKNINANLYILYLRLDFSSPSIHHLSKTGDVRRGVFFSWKTSRFVAGTDRDGALLQKPRQCFLECKTLHGKNYWNLDPKRTTILKWLHHLYLEN